MNQIKEHQQKRYSFVMISPLNTRKHLYFDLLERPIYLFDVFCTVRACNQLLRLKNESNFLFVVTESKELWIALLTGRHNFLSEIRLHFK